MYKYAFPFFIISFNIITPAEVAFGKNAKKHIRGVRLHFLPQSEAGTQALYDGITFEKEK